MSMTNASKPKHAVQESEGMTADLGGTEMRAALAIS